MRSGGRVVEGARLESEYTSKAYPGFESLPLRHFAFFMDRDERLRTPKTLYLLGFQDSSGRACPPLFAPNRVLIYDRFYD